MPPAASAIIPHTMTRPFTNRRLTEPAAIRRQAPGARNEYGEFVPGDTTDQDIRVITWPGGATREPLPPGQRLTDMRNFCLDKSPQRGAAPVTALGDNPPREQDAIVYAGAVYDITDVLDWGDYWELRTLKSNDAP